MSFFDIFKRKPKPKPCKVTVEVMGSTYEVTAEGKKLSDADRERIAKRRQERKEKERLLDLRDKWMAIGMAFAAYRQLMDTPETSYPDDRICNQLREAHAELLRITKEADFGECLQLAVNDYRKMNKRKPTEEQMRFATHPEEFSPEDMIGGKWLAYLIGYRDYWEGQIGQLKRKSAVANRRRYLIEKIDALIEKASSLQLDKAAEQLREYKRYNERMLPE